MTLNSFLFCIPASDLLYGLIVHVSYAKVSADCMHTVRWKARYKTAINEASITCYS